MMHKSESYIDNIKVSVIIPVYNKAKYLEKCIKSVLDSTLMEIEIICVDDGSEDDSAAVLERYQLQDSRIAIINNPRNMGVAYSRNVAIDIARGKYMFFLDADDYILADALKIYFGAMEAEDLQGCFITMHTGKNGEVSIKGSYRDVYEGTQLLKVFSGNNEEFLYACGALWRTDFIRDNGIRFRNLKIGEGGLFILQSLLKAQRVSHVDYPGYHYEVNNTSVNKGPNHMRYSAIGQAVQIAYLLLQLKDATDDDNIIEFLENYIRKNIGGILNLESIDSESMPISRTEAFLTSLIRGDFLYTPLGLSKEEQEMVKQSGRVYFYGAGYETMKALRFVNNLGIRVEKIFVSPGHMDSRSMYGHEVVCFDEGNVKDKSIPIIITASKKHQPEIKRLLRNSGIENIIEI